MTDVQQKTEPNTTHGCGHGQDMPRRKFLMALGVTMGGISSLVAGVPIVGYLLAPMVSIEADKWIVAGSLDQFPVGKTRLVKLKNKVARPWDGKSGEVSAYVRCVAEQQFQVFSVNCTHLGCPVSWFEQSGLFLCPCHGGVYYADGERASGPPPRGLYHYPHRIDKKSNQLMVRIGHLPTLNDVPAQKA